MRRFLRHSLVVVDAWLWFVSDKQPVFNVDAGIMCIDVRTTELCIVYCIWKISVMCFLSDVAGR